MTNHKDTDLPNMEIPNRQVLWAAHDFGNAALLLHEHGGAFCPLLMTGTFALELYLKALNSKIVRHPEGGVWRYTAEPIKWGHKLTELYDALEDDVRLGLNEAFLVDMINSNVDCLRDALLPYDQVFVDSRYAFEDGVSFPPGVHTQILIELLRIVRNHVLSFRTEMRHCE